jgi:hypothetical protein
MQPHRHYAPSSPRPDDALLATLSHSSSHASLCHGSVGLSYNVASRTCHPFSFTDQVKYPRIFSVPRNADHSDAVSILRDLFIYLFIHSFVYLFVCLFSDLFLGIFLNCAKCPCYILSLNCIHKRLLARQGISQLLRLIWPSGVGSICDNKPTSIGFFVVNITSLFTG